MSATEGRWEHQPERGSVWLMRTLSWTALHVGRPVARVVIYFLTAYFLATSVAARRASRAFLSRVLPRRPRLWDVARHFFAFAAVSLDRVLLLASRSRSMLDVELHASEQVLQLVRERGCLLIVAHFGSFEVMRVPAVAEQNLRLQIVLDRAVGRRFMSLLEALNPQMAASIIDSSARGPELVLRIRDAVADGTMVGLMADRLRAGERFATVQFLGAPARLPVAPWLIAGSLRAPVITAFGIYRGGRRYEAHFELLTEGVALPRGAERDGAVQALAQAYADRLAHYARSAPYNWFNFYDFWQQ